MEAIWTAKRIALWQLLNEPVRRTNQQLADLVGMSPSWVQKWRTRVAEADGQAIIPFQSQSRQRHTSPRQITEPVEAKILHLRDHLTEQYQRRVGARNILYHLQHDEDLRQLGAFIPRSASTVHAVLVKYGRVPRPAPPVHVPREPAAPLQVWEIDFSDVITAHSAETSKRAHQVEVFDVVDTGTSIALETRVSDRFDAEHTLLTLVDVFDTVGVPQVLRFDRDPRFITSWSADGFPSALMRFLLCLGVKPDVCPPRRPDLKPYVERFIRTQKEECIYPRRPGDVMMAQQLINTHRSFYNLERPNQAITCGNRPPSLALEDVPRLPRLPAQVDPDAWLRHYHRRSFRRHIAANGSVLIGSHRYYIKKQLAGRPMVMRLDAANQQFDAWVGSQRVKTVAIKGLFHGELPLTNYVDYMVAEARSEEKRLKAKRRR